MNPYRGTIAPGNLERLLVQLRERAGEYDLGADKVRLPDLRSRWRWQATEIRSVIRLIERERDEELERILDEEDEERAARSGAEVREE